MLKATPGGMESQMPFSCKFEILMVTEQKFIVQITKPLIQI